MENFPQIECFLERFHKFQADEIELIKPCFSYLELKRGDVFIEKDKPVNFMAFIISGVAAACDLNASIESICYFVSENHFVSEAVGLYKNEPSDLTIKALTNLKMLVINTEQIEMLDNQIFNLKNTFLAISVDELTEIVKMQNLPRKGDTMTKFLEFRQCYPNIYKQIKMSDIASYLNISPFTISRLKRSVGE